MHWLDLFFYQRFEFYIDRSSILESNFFKNEIANWVQYSDKYNVRSAQYYSE